MPERTEERLLHLGLRKVHEASNGAKVNLWGVVIVVGSLVIGVLFFLTAVVAKLFPLSDIRWIKAIQEDEYYCYLLPLMIVPTYAIMYLNWLSMTIFLNN